MTHQLLFGGPVPGGQREGGRYRLSWRGTAVMGVLNVTPDSFSDGGRYQGSARALAHARKMLKDGALIIDVGGESTRPGAEPVSAEEEIDRVRPVVARLSLETEAVISIDTQKAEVAQAALLAGAHLVNDVRGLRDPEMLEVVSGRAAPAIIMHMQGEPQTMQRGPHYHDVVAEVQAFLRAQAATALAAGVPAVMLDPGIGFGKTLAHNLTLLRNLERLVALGHPLLLGASRKGMIAAIAGASKAAARDPGSVALHLHGASLGVAMVRAHNVLAHRQALAVWQALRGEGGGDE